MTRWIAKNGKRIPLTGSGSGKGAVVAAGVLAVGLSTGVGSGGLTLGGSGAVPEVGVGSQRAVRGAGSGGSPQLKARKSEGQKSARKGDADAAWQRLGMRQLKRTARQR